MKSFNITIMLIVIFFASWQRNYAEKITVLQLGDTHSCMSPGGPRDENLNGLSGGVARAATVIGLTKMEDPNAILLHCGDISIGDLFFNTYFAVPELTFLKMFGCDALTLGNHEFDLTPQVLQLALDTAFKDGGFPIISTNFETYGNPELAGLKKYVSPYKIIEKYGLKIGVFGLTTPETNILSQPAPVFIDTLIVERSAMAVAELQSQNCDIIIMASHLGAKYDAAVAYYVPGIDLILGAHDHFVYEEPKRLPCMDGSTVPAIETGSQYSNIGKIVIDYSDKKINSIDFTLIPLDENIPEEPNAKAAVDELIAGIEAVYGPMYNIKAADITETFSEMAAPVFDEPGNLDTPVGNLVCDAFLAWGGTDIAIEPSGSTAQPLYKGPATNDDVFRMLGYGFNTANGLGYRMAKFDILGQYLAYGLEFGLSEIEFGDDYLLQTGGMTYLCDINKPPYSRLLYAEVNGEPLQMDKTYSVSSNEFVVMFLNSMGLPYSNLVIENELTEFQVVLGYIMQLQVLSPKEGGRITTPVAETPVLKCNAGATAAFPNPCDMYTKLTFDIDTPGEYTIRVYNALGYETDGPKCKYFDAGINESPLYTGELGDGVYTYIISGKQGTISGAFLVCH